MRHWRRSPVNAPSKFQLGFNHDGIANFCPKVRREYRLGRRAHDGAQRGEGVDGERESPPQCVVLVLLQSRRGCVSHRRAIHFALEIKQELEVRDF